MEKITSPSALPSNPPSKENKEPASQQQKRRSPPTPSELVAHYESQGLDSKEASLKAIEDLQNVLFRIAGQGRIKNKKEKFMLDCNRKLDNINTRLAILEMKVDSKPGFGETLVIGVTSGAIFQGIAGAVPHILKGASDIWSTVRSSTRS